MPWPTWTTRSPSRSSRKLSIARPSRRRGGPAQVGAAEQLAAAEQHDPLGHQAEAALQRADGKVQPALAGQSACRAKTSRQPPDLGLGLADDEHLLAGAGLVQLVADAVDVAAEALDRFDLQPAGRFQRAGRHGRGGDRRKPEHLLQHVGTSCKSCGPFEPLQVVPALLLAAPSARSAGTSFAAADSRPDAPRSSNARRRESSPRPRPACARLRWLETSNRRIDSISSPKNSTRTGSYQSGAKMSTMPPRTENSPGNSTAGVLWKPFSTSQRASSSTRQSVADAKRPRLPGQRLAVGHRLQQALDAGDHQLRRLGRLQQLQQPQPVAEDLVVDRLLVGQRFPGRETARASIGVNSARSSIRSSTSSTVRADDHQRGRGVRGQRGRHQRARRAPDSVESRRMSRLQTLDDLGEAFLPLQTSDQFQQPVRRGIGPRSGRLGGCHHLGEL